MSYSRPKFGRLVSSDHKVRYPKKVILVTEMGCLMIVKSFKDIDAVHKRSSGTAHRNFKANRSRFIEGVDCFKVCADEIRLNKIENIESLLGGRSISGEMCQSYTLNQSNYPFPRNIRMPITRILNALK